MTKNPIKLLDPLSVATYFFFTEIIAIYISSEFGGIGEPLTKMIREHIAPMSFHFIGGITLFVTYVYSIFNRLEKPRDNTALNILIVSPANFVVTLGFVAVAVSWGEYLAIDWFAEFPLIDESTYLPVISNNAAEITLQAFLLWAFLRVLYINVNDLEDPEHVTNAKLTFGFSMFMLTVFFVSFWGRIVWNAWEYLA